MIMHRGWMCYGGIFDYDSQKDRLDEVNRELEESSIWDDPKKAQDLGRERSRIHKIVSSIDEISNTVEEYQEFLNILIADQDETGFLELKEEVNVIGEKIKSLEFRRMFSGEVDLNNAYLDIQAGSGGTEAQDWAGMLLRMYLRWCEEKGFVADVTEVSDGEVAGIKSATISVSGDYAFGWLRTETGIHRLVRKSPFDSGARRHTSFASVFVAPEIDDSVNVEINPSDLRIDTYRASGAGGQHVNRTDSAVRITHNSSGIVVQCQNQRSQHQNRDAAMKQLRAKLYEREMELRKLDAQKLEDSKSDIGWGSQIRSYVLDQSRIKDHRTGIEISSPQMVLDGSLDLFIEASLKMGL